jgi:thioredoxin reductase (NADPH)
VVLLGAADSADCLSLQNFLRRNAVPYTPLDPATDAEARALIERLGITSSELPLAICPDGAILRKPGEKALAQCLGLLPSYLADRNYDVVIVGAGPAGLAAAVYGASEGLSVLVLDARSFGGQAGASARIENYLGFPTGISGAALAGRAYVQAEKFGAVMAIPAEVRQLRALPDDRFELELADAQPVRAAAVVIASGARYRRLELPNLSTFEGRGIYYWASPIELRLCARRDVVVVGGGNSAGQGVVYLASHVSHVDLLIRGPSLNDSMSQYLVDRIHALTNVTVHTETDVTQLIGDATEGLQAVCWRERGSDREERHPIHHVFLFIGAVPSTDWLKGCDVKVDRKGFVHTGFACSSNVSGEAADPIALWLETSLPGVFAVGDVRAGSVKRVSAAVGEGAGVVPQLHQRLQALRPQPHAEQPSRPAPQPPPRGGQDAQGVPASA